MTTATPDKGAVIVTGASRGIGAAIAERLADDGYGVIVNYTADAGGADSVVSDIKAKGGRATAVRADVASEEDVAAMFVQAREQMDPITGLVNNAGILGEVARIDEQQADELARLMQVNVVGSMMCAKHAVRAMSTARGGKGGSIVTIASIAAKAPVGVDGVVPYEATKGALVSFARGLSNEVAAEGIRSNSVSPGVIDTDMAASPKFQDMASAGPDGPGRPSRRDRGDRIVAAVARVVVRHGQRYHRLRRPLSGRAESQRGWLSARSAALADGQDRGLGAVLDSEFREHGADVRLHGLL